MSFAQRNIALSRDQLTQEFECELSVPVISATGRSNELLARFRVRAGQGSSWTERFSDIVLFYPALQAECMDVEREFTRSATLAHSLLLVHTFLDDRCIDGQMGLSEKDVEFVRSLFLKGTQKLETLFEEPGRFNSIRTQALERHVAESFLHQTPHLQSADGLVRDYNIVRASSGKAALGFLSTAALAERAGLNDIERRRMSAAYNATVTALQWMDDLEDASEDACLGDCNLLIDTLLDRGAELRSLTGSSKRCMRVTAAILESDAIEQALEQARRWFGFAVIRQERLGCSALVDELNRYISRLDRAESRIRKKYEEALLVGALLG